jgi:hypothetical protein
MHVIGGGPNPLPSIKVMYIGKYLEVKQSKGYVHFTRDVDHGTDNKELKLRV